MIPPHTPLVLFFIFLYKTFIFLCCQDVIFDHFDNKPRRFSEGCSLCFLGYHFLCCSENESPLLCAATRGNFSFSDEEPDRDVRLCYYYLRGIKELRSLLGSISEGVTADSRSFPTLFELCYAGLSLCLNVRPL
jgi:hypothetical protein